MELCLQPNLRTTHSQIGELATLVVRRKPKRWQPTAKKTSTTWLCQRERAEVGAKTHQDVVRGRTRPEEVEAVVTAATLPVVRASELNKRPSKLKVRRTTSNPSQRSNASERTRLFVTRRRRK